MCGSMVDIQSPTAEIRRGKKKKEETTVEICRDAPNSPTDLNRYSGPKFTILRRHVEEILLLNTFFPIVDTCLSCEDMARQS